MKKLICPMVVLIIFIFTLSCNLFGYGNGRVANQKQNTDFKELRVLLEDTPWHRNIEKTIGNFEKDTGIKAKLEFIPEVQSREKVDLDLASGTGLYDVFLTDQMYIQMFAKLGALLPLNEFVDDDRDFEKNDFPDLALKTNTFDGKLYGIPWRNAYNILIYRKDLLEKYHVKVPRTMNELMNAAVTIRRALIKDGRKDVYGITMRGLRGEGLNIWIIGQSFFPAWGGKWFDKKGRPTVNSPEMVNALNFYATLLQRAGPPDAALQSWDDCYWVYEQGKAAFFIDSAIQCSLIMDAKGLVADKTGVALIPTGPNGTRHPGLYNPSYVISAKAKNKDYAWRFIKWATSSKQMLSDAIEGGNFEIARKSILLAPEFKKRFPYNELIKVVLESKNYAREERPMIIRWPEVGNIMGEVVQKVIAGKTDAKTGLDEAQKKISQIYEKGSDGLK